MAINVAITYVNLHIKALKLKFLLIFFVAFHFLMSFFSFCFVCQGEKALFNYNGRQFFIRLVNIPSDYFEVLVNKMS